MEQLYRHANIRKGLTAEEAEDYRNGKVKVVIHNREAWEVVDCTKDVLPLDNPPSTYTIKIRKKI